MEPIPGPGRRAAAEPTIPFLAASAPLADVPPTQSAALPETLVPPPAVLPLPSALPQQARQAAVMPQGRGPAAPPPPPAPAIEITIGRIEIRAETPPPARPKPLRPAPHISLADYKSRWERAR